MDIIVRVPAIPEHTYRSIQSQVGWFKEKTNLLRWKVKVGDWVEKEQIVAYYEVNNTSTLRGGTLRAIIVAPFAGEILTIQNKDYTQWEKPDGTMKSEDDFTSHDILFVIKPSKDIEQSYPDYAKDSAMYNTYIHLAIFTEHAKIPNDGFTMTHTKAKVETLNS